jgi:hypothetical protein
VPAGDSVLVVPLPSFTNPHGIYWSVHSGLDLPISHGYFLGPLTEQDRRGRSGAIPRPTDALLLDAHRTGAVPAITDQHRAQARADLAYWRTAIILVPDDARLPDSLRQTVAELVGQPGTRDGGVWVWDVRSLR